MILGEYPKHNALTTRMAGDDILINKYVFQSKLLSNISTLPGFRWLLFKSTVFFQQGNPAELDVTPVPSKLYKRCWRCHQKKHMFYLRMMWFWPNNISFIETTFFIQQKHMLYFRNSTCLRDTSWKAGFVSAQACIRDKHLRAKWLCNSPDSVACMHP